MEGIAMVSVVSTALPKNLRCDICCVPLPVNVGSGSIAHRFAHSPKQCQGIGDIGGDAKKPRKTFHAFLDTLGVGWVYCVFQSSGCRLGVVWLLPSSSKQPRHQPTL